MRDLIIITLITIIVGCDGDSLKVKRLNEKEVNRIEGSWQMKSLEIISTDSEGQELVPNSLELVLKPCSFNSNNNRCELSFSIDDGAIIDTYFSLGVSPLDKTSLILDKGKADAQYTSKEVLLLSSTLELLEIEDRKLRVHIFSSSPLNYNLTLNRK